MKKVESSDWATPIVPVLKPNETVRICSDFKLTINPYLDVPEYPMSNPEELFTKLTRANDQANDKYQANDK